VTPKSLRVLIVEDNVAQAESLALLLRAYGHAAYHAPTAVGARLLAETHPPDAVILDLVLPGDGARELIDWLRSRPATENVPVAVTTGLPAERAAEFEGLPWVTVLTKPFEVADLLAALGLPPGGDR
jgi:DNA-binding response OmpR family regulator